MARMLFIRVNRAIIGLIPNQPGKYLNHDTGAAGWSDKLCEVFVRRGTDDRDPSGAMPASLLYSGDKTFSL